MEEEYQLRPIQNPYGGISYFYGGTIAIIASWLMATTLSGCRFGNYSSSSAPPPSLTGYYGASPQTLQFCATTSATNCVQSSTTRIPELISSEISNPVALIIQDESTGDAVLTAASGKGQTALPIWVSDDNVALYYTASTSPQTLWQDPSCTTTTYLSEKGAIMPGGGQPVPGANTSTIGTLTLKVEVTQTFEGLNGSCGPELQIMSHCYQDVSQCGGSSSGANQQLQAQVQQIFSDYIQAGAMTGADIATITNVAYEAHYQ